MFLCPQKLPRCLSARGKLAFAPDGCKGLLGFPRRLRSNGARFDCRTIVYLAKRQKAFSTDRLARSFVAQMYILLILQSQYFKPEKTYVFGLDVSFGCGLAVRLASGT